MKTKMLQILALLSLAFAGAAQAVPIQFSISGEVTAADAGNAFGLDVGDLVTATAIFDDSLFTDVGESIIFFGQGTGNSLDHEIGAITFVESMDIDFLDTNLPALVFSNGIFDTFNFIVFVGVNGGPAGLNSFAGFSAVSDGLSVAGNWLADTGTFTAVPEPATLLLLALGLLTLGLRRRA